MLLAGGLVMPDGADGLAFSGAVWLFHNGTWQEQQGWDDLAVGEGDLDIPGNPPPLGLALALRAATCEALGIAVGFGDDPGSSPPEVVTVRFGWDRTGDGAADGCWAVSEALAAPGPGATTPPAVGLSPTPRTPSSALANLAEPIPLTPNASAAPAALRFTG